MKAINRTVNELTEQEPNLTPAKLAAELLGTC